VITETIPGIAGLQPAEKLLLVRELWDDLERHPTEIPVSREIIEELDRRLEDYGKNPDAVTTWEEAKARILGHEK